MKVCLVLQRQFAYIGHNVALWLKEKHGVQNFCGYVYQRWSYDFLKNQKDVKYSSLLLDEDIHKEYLNEKLDLEYLKILEKKYGLPNLWPYIALDRVLMFNQVVREYPYNTPAYTHEEMMRIFQVKARAIIKFLETEKPDAILFPNIGGIGTMVLYEVAKKMGIKPLILLTACTEDRYVFSEKFDYFTDVEKLIAKNKNQSSSYLTQAKQFIENFRNKPEPYHPDVLNALKTINRRNQLKFLYPTNFIKSLSWFVQVIKIYFTNRKFNDYSDNFNPWYYLLDRVKRKFRNLIGTNNLYDSYTPEEDFGFFPLHLEPEVSTLLNAPFYTDQICLIKQIARSLPLHFKLYVKEHPLMAEYRPRKYYKELKKIPNVKLINPKINGLDIVSKAKIIFPITSTAGWEGALLKKPVIAFGDQFFNILSMVKKCKEIEQLPFMIQDSLENYKYNEQEVLNLLAAIFEDSIPLNLHQLWEQETDMTKKRLGTEQLANLLAKKIIND